MFDEARKVMTENFVYPLAFIVVCCAIFMITGAGLYYRFARGWLPEKLAALLGFAGCGYILIATVNHVDWVKTFIGRFFN